MPKEQPLMNVNILFMSSRYANMTTVYSERIQYLMKNDKNNKERIKTLHLLWNLYLKKHKKLLHYINN
jgi:hypothetical protein